MYLGEVSKTQLVSVALMIMFAMATMFFLGYRLAYGKAITYANDQIVEKIDEFKSQYNIGRNPDFDLGNIDMPDFSEIK